MRRNASLNMMGWEFSICGEIDNHMLISVVIYWLSVSPPPLRLSCTRSSLVIFMSLNIRLLQFRLPKLVMSLELRTRQEIVVYWNRSKQSNLRTKTVVMLICVTVCHINDKFFIHQRQQVHATVTTRSTIQSNVYLLPSCLLYHLIVAVATSVCM